MVVFGESIITPTPLFRFMHKNPTRPLPVDGVGDVLLKNEKTKVKTMPKPKNNKGQKAMQSGHTQNGHIRMRVNDVNNGLTIAMDAHDQCKQSRISMDKAKAMLAWAKATLTFWVSWAKLSDDAYTQKDIDDKVAKLTATIDRLKPMTVDAKTKAKRDARTKALERQMNELKAELDGVWGDE